MHYSKSTYKQILAYLFLSVYLCCTLSIPIFEGIHFLIHLEDDAPIHSFQSHQSLHNHQILTAFNDLVESDNTTKLPSEAPKKIKIKKLVQIGHNFTVQSFRECDIYLSKFNINSPFYQSPALKILAPPPKV